MTDLHLEPRSPALAPPMTSTRRPRRALRNAITSTAGAIVGALLVVIGLNQALSEPASTVTAATEVTGIETEVAATATSGVSGLEDVSDIAAAVTDSVVTVEVTGEFQGRQQMVGSGSGVIVTADGNIVTNAHVVTAGTGVDVVLSDGTIYTATVVGVDEEHDLALIDIEATGLDPVEIGSTASLLVGDPVIAVGYPLALEGGPSVSTGIVSALDRTLQDGAVDLTGVIQTDAAITEGSSGGALLDSQGRLIGITTAVGVSSVGVEGIGFAIPVETITQVLTDIAV